MQMVIIDATREGLSAPESDAPLQEVVAQVLSLPVEEVQAQWVAVGLVGGMEGVSPEVVRREVVALETQVTLQGRQLSGLQPVIVLQEYAEGATVAANCAFSCRVQSLTGREPHLIGVVQKADARRWQLDYSFSPADRAA